MSLSTNKIPEQLKVVRAWIAAFNAHDVAAIVALYAPEAELCDAGMRHVRRGTGEIETWFTRRFASMPEITYTPADELVADEMIAVTWTTRGRTPRLLGQRWLARPFAVEGVSIFTLRDGQILRQRGYYDHLAVVERALPFLRWLPTRM
ncbi:MAG TPA: nuclear transport factor 2 family protein [Ktedonobacteraceae bacterium]|nr:nuclear transport factor 2 family protein [Ktedonobacteraceae bacterium]